MVTNIVQTDLISDVIVEVLEHLSSIRDILSALLVNREWSRAAIPIYWKAPFNYPQEFSKTALKTYELFLKNESTKDTNQKKLTALYDYPSFLKVLNYTNLLASETSKYDRCRKINEILQMLKDHGVRLDSLIIENIGANNEGVYGLWAASAYTPYGLWATSVYTPILSFLNS
ncbi:6395_t:CDS:1, partial [Scutellospora calospora]